MAKSLKFIICKIFFSTIDIKVIILLFYSSY